MYPMSALSFEANLESIRQLTEGIPDAFDKAGVLEAQAKALRADALESQALAFESASNQLVECFRAGNLTALETVSAVARLSDLDPTIVSMYKGQCGNQIIDNFKALRIGAPLLGLSTFDRTPTGIVKADPEVVELSARAKSRSTNFIQPFMAPSGKIAVAISTLKPNGQPHDKLVSAEIGSLRSAVIGRAAVQKLVVGQEFNTRSDRSSCHPETSTNTSQLRAIKANVLALYSLGMEPIDTTMLDSALAQAEAYEANESHSEVLRLKRYLHPTWLH